jgi:hypothetical protein
MKKVTLSTVTGDGTACAGKILDGGLYIPA